MLRTLALPTVIALTAAHLGCAHLPVPIEKPTASVEGVAIGSISLTGATGELDLAISNPNGFGVPLAAVDWQLSIGAAKAVSGHVELSETIPARATAPVMASLSIDTRDAASVAAAIAGGTRTYTVRGTLRFQTSAGSIDVAFEHTGELRSIARL